jgi:DNA-binding transcriptional MerR regulator
MATSETRVPLTELTVDELAARSGLPTRTIREYQTMGLVPPPERRGRVGVYRGTHLQRLELIGRLQQRGYSLAGIRDLLTSWQSGEELTDVLGLTPDELVHLDEPGAPTTMEQLARLLPQLVPHRIEELVETRVVDRIGPERYCIPSPSLLQLTIDALAVGYPPDVVLDLLGTVRDAADQVAKSVHALLTAPPPGVDARELDHLATRGRGLLAHGTGRLAVYSLGQRLTDGVRGRRT